MTAQNNKRLAFSFTEGLKSVQRADVRRQQKKTAHDQYEGTKGQQSFLSIYNRFHNGSVHQNVQKPGNTGYDLHVI